MRLKPQLALIPQSENLPGLEVTIEPWKKLMVHEVIEYPFDDLVRLVLLQARAAGGGISSMNWCNGIVFQHTVFPDTDSMVQEKLRGTIHYSSVVFAAKEKYEKQVVRDAGTLNLTDVSANAIFRALVEVLKKRTA